MNFHLVKILLDFAHGFLVFENNALDILLFDFLNFSA